tara:strand:- start:15287 stop:15748 length:462 start_codon:yes stop_codon:yes gene_type:complete
MSFFSNLAKRAAKAASKQTPGQAKVEQATKGQRVYALGQIKGAAAGAGATGLTAAVIGKMSLDEMRQRMKTATNEKDRALLNEAITKAVAEAKDYVETKPTTSLRPKSRPNKFSKGSMPKKYAKGGYSNCGASMKATQKSTNMMYGGMAKKDK